MTRVLGICVATVALLVSILHAAAAEAKELVVLETTVGDVVIELFSDSAPLTTGQFEALVRAGAYDGTPWKRIISGFITQTGLVESDRRRPLTDDQAVLVQTLPQEVSGEHLHLRGALSMARFSDPNSATSSFSVLVEHAPHLDGEYTVFGHVIDGMEIIDAIASLPTDAADAPISDVAIERARLIPSDSLATLDLNTSDPTPPPPPRTALTDASSLEPGVSLALAGAFVCSVIAYLAGGRLSPRTSTSFVLLAALSAGFGLFRILIPARSPTLGLLVFIGLFALLRLISRFEAVDRPPAEVPSYEPGATRDS